MHNCKETREQLTELLLDGADDRAEEVLDQCGECRAEFEAVAATLRMTSRLRETVTPGESYWTSYHTLLRRRLTDASESFHAKAQRLRHAKPQSEELKPGLGFVFASLRQPLRLCVKTFFQPLPVPLGLALLAVGLMLTLVAFRTARQPITQSQAPVVVQVPVEVPVVQEKIVTQVVYRDRKPAPRSPKRVVVSGPPTDSAVARSQKQPEDTLSGFKPTDEVKLTVIKGGSPNEK
jgi:hypothetical protein